VFEIGASLTAARTSEGLSLGDAERLTNLRARYLDALEREDFELLPGRAYARAFLRTYADALELDADRFVAEFEERYPEEEHEPPAVVHVRRARRPFPAKTVIAVAALAAVVGALAWSGFSTPSPAPSVAAPPHRVVHHTLAVQHVHKAPPKPQPLLIRAVAGDCWVQVRRGGASGPVIYEGTLTRGQALRYGPRVWVRLGAPWNVSVQRGAKAFPARSQTQPENLVA
jgi:hypothetical protein